MMKIERISGTEILIKNNEPIFTLGDESVIVVTENPVKSYSVSFAKRKNDTR